jgi:predicted Zn-dependent protease
MRSLRRKRFTLMPAVALAGLSALVSVPVLSSSHLYAAAPQRYSSVIVRPGDSLWSLAADHTPAGANVQDTIDRIASVNHLEDATIVPGERLSIPD